MNVLVTGAGGFLGEYIVEALLARGDLVTGFARGQYPHLQEQGVCMLQGDIRDKAAVMSACENQELVIHTAAVAGIWGPWDYFHGINTVGTANVLAGCQEHQVKQLVYTSSPSVTFDGSDQCDVNETAPYPQDWLCYYPQTKAAAEQMVLTANGTNGLSTCALRPHLIWGPRDQHLIPRLLERAKSGKLRIVGDGSNLVDMIYVENAALAHLQAAEALATDSLVAGKAYFLSQGEPVNCWDWINEILALAHLPPITKKISFSAAWKIGQMMEWVYQLMRKKTEPRMTRFLAAQLARHHYFDISAAQQDFNFQPAISTEEGMQRLKESLKES